MVTIGDKRTGFGGPVLGVVLAMAYVITHQAMHNDMENFYLESFEMQEAGEDGGADVGFETDNAGEENEKKN